ncbi:MAG: hypothetical protein ABJH63_11740 [Rhizobiaceae bacterium]
MSKSTKGVKRAVVYLGSKNLGKFDAFFPLLVTLSELVKGDENIKLYTAMPLVDGEDALKLASFHYRMVKRLSIYVGPIRLPFLESSINIALFVLFILRLRIYGKEITILTSWIGKGKIEILALNLISKLGKLVFVPPLQTPQTKAYGERFKNWEKLVDLGLKHSNSNTSSFQFEHGICWTDEERELNAYEFVKQVHPIGLPRLYPEWETFLLKETEGVPVVCEDESGETLVDGEFGVIILTNPHFVWFPNGVDDYLAMLREVIAFSNRRFPDGLIVLKPKYLMRQMFIELLKEHKLISDKIVLADESLSVLAARASWAATINESSGVLDFVCMGVPTLEYARYDTTWLEVSASGSAWKELPGMTYAEDSDEVGVFFDSLGSNSAHQYREQLKCHLRHKRDLSILNFDVC